MVNFWWKPTSWLADSCLLALSSHGSGEREGEEEGEGESELWSLLIRVRGPLNKGPHHEDPTCITSPKPNYLPKAPPLDAITLGVRGCLGEWGVGGSQRLVHNRPKQVLSARLL